MLSSDIPLPAPQLPPQWPPFAPPLLSENTQYKMNSGPLSSALPYHTRDGLVVSARIHGTGKNDTSRQTVGQSRPVSTTEHVHQ